MTTTIYPGIEASTVPLTPSMSLYGTDWTVIRASGGTVSTAPTLMSMGTVAHLGVVPNKVNAAVAALPQIAIYSAPYFGWGPSDIAVQVDDVLISVDYPDTAFLVLGEPMVLGPALIPLAPCAVPPAFDESILDDEGSPLLDDV
jgi:hypothetical protein